MSTFLGTNTAKSTTPEKKTKSSNRKSYTPSSGMLKLRLHKRTIRMLTKKIARWEANKANGKKANVGRKSKGKNAKKPQRIGGKVANRNTWNTEGLKKQLAEVSARR